MQMKNFALPRQEVVFDIEPQSMVSRCRRNTATEISSAMAAVSLFPSSIAWSAADRA